VAIHTLKHSKYKMNITAGANHAEIAKEARRYVEAMRPGTQFFLGLEV
jgi:hypothetical protein